MFLQAGNLGLNGAGSQRDLQNVPHLNLIGRLGHIDVYGNFAGVTGIVGYGVPFDEPGLL